MPYLHIQDFRAGMDRKRKLREVGDTGSAWTIKNAHLTRGGDIDRRKKFVQQETAFPTTTRGLAALNDSLYTFGYDIGGAGSLPSGVTQITTQHPTPTVALIDIKDEDAFDGKLYSIAEFEDGNIYHYYDDDRVTDWDTLASDIGSNTAIASALAAAISKSATVNATSSSSVVTITAEENDIAFTVATATVNNGSNPDQTLIANTTQVHGPAQPQITEVTVGGTFETADQFKVTINTTEEYIVTGGSSGTGTTVITFKQKLYSTAASNLYFCALNSPTQWIAGLDYGFINMASQTAGQETLTAVEEYQGLLAIFSENNTRIWSISEDSTENVFLQTVKNTGTVAPKSVLAYGNNDVFYLATSGIRSLKARDSSNAAYVSDVGTAIDTHVREYLDTLSEAQIEISTSVVEPIDGRFWMGIHRRIYVLSYFPSAKISAWSYYEVDFDIKNIVKIRNRIYLRGTADDGNDYLYLYGGTGNDEYPADDEDNITIEIPFLDGENPAGFKELIGFDIIGINTWDVDLLPEPGDHTVIEPLGITDGITYNKPRYGVDGIVSLFGLNLTCSKAGAATFSALAMHYSGKFEDG